jgi:hypothetical protein
MLARRRSYPTAALAVLVSWPASFAVAQVARSTRTHSPPDLRRSYLITEPPQTKPPRLESAAIQTLEKRIDHVSWDAQSLESVLEWLRQQGPANVVPVWRALDVLGVGPDTKVTLQLEDVTVHQLLVEVCDQLSPAGGMGFQGHGNIIKISSQRHLDSKLYVQVYEVRDVIFDIPDFVPGGGCCAGASGGGLDGYVPLEFRMQNLANLVRKTIGCERLVEKGGDCTVEVFETSLVVRAPISVHEKIGGSFYLP